MNGAETEEARIERVAAEILRRLIESRSAGGRASSAAIDVLISDEVDRCAALLSGSLRATVAARIRREATGLGPLEPLLDDPEIDEVMVNGSDAVYVERSGRIELTDVRFDGEDQLRNAIERILSPLGRRVDELSPMADARLPDGSRVNVVIPPLAVDGPTVSIRRFAADRPGPERLIEMGTLTEPQAERLREAVAGRASIVVSGGTGSGKTTLLNALARFIDADERIVTIEDAAELDLGQPHVIRLESRPSSIEGRGEVTIRDLLRNALRMRPDRIVIGEVRGAEALDLLTALNTGHDGAMSTVHANSAADALSRIEVLALMAGVGLPFEVIGAQLRRGVDLVVHISRRADGGRRVTEIVEVTR